MLSKRKTDFEIISKSNLTSKQTRENYRVTQYSILSLYQSPLSWSRWTKNVNRPRSYWRETWIRTKKRMYGRTSPQIHADPRQKFGQDADSGQTRELDKIFHKNTLTKKWINVNRSKFVTRLTRTTSIQILESSSTSSTNFLRLSSGDDRRPLTA